MQDELKKVISQAMNTSSTFEQELTEEITKEELSDEALEAVAGGVICVEHSHGHNKYGCRLLSFRYERSANNKV